MIWANFLHVNNSHRNENYILLSQSISDTCTHDIIESYGRVALILSPHDEIFHDIVKKLCGMLSGPLGYHASNFVLYLNYYSSINYRDLQ
jgi:hypothetical protein